MTTAGDLPRRGFLKLTVGAGALVTAGPLLTACAKTTSDTVKVGVVYPRTGSGSAVGQLSFDSLLAASQHLNATGGIGGRKVELVFRDTRSDPAVAADAYGALVADPGTVGILWCGAPGLDQVLPRIADDGIPVIAVFSDPLSSGHLFPAAGAPRSLFQVSVGDVDVKRVLADYALKDRGYASAALLYDRGLDVYGDTRAHFAQAFGGTGLALAGVETFGTGDGDMGAQLDTLRGQRSQVLFVDGYSDDAARIVSRLADMGSAYVDTPTAKGPDWRPQVFGSLRDVNQTWAEVAGEKARVGTATAWALGGLPFLPFYAVGGWLERYVGKVATGGEEAPADGLATLMEGMKKAGSTDRAGIVRGIETMGKIRFATIPFGYGGDRHNAVGPEDVVVMALDRLRGPERTEPPYDLGHEWQEGQAFADVGAAPTLLVRPTLDANKTTHPDVMARILADGYGTQCTRLPDGALVKECKIH
ncbi:MAG: ABC transporter substrate-binding protein [Acidimicrobiales bacterium]